MAEQLASLRVVLALVLPIVLEDLAARGIAAEAQAATLEPLP
jgi:hypothetical protein